MVEEERVFTGFSIPPNLANIYRYLCPAPTV
jgi:hypothetical protein